MKRKIGQMERLLLLEEKFIIPYSIRYKPEGLYIDAEKLCIILMSEKAHWRSHALFLARHNYEAEKRIERLMSKKISISVSQIIGGCYGKTK